MGLGLYLDLAVGVRQGGADSWSAPACFAEGVSLAAPPDAFNPAGQNWGLAPFNPAGLRRAAYRPFVQMLRSEEHTSELQSLMRISYAVFCLKKKTRNQHDQLKVPHKVETQQHTT